MKGALGSSSDPLASYCIIIPSIFTEGVWIADSLKMVGRSYRRAKDNSSAAQRAMGG
jgi:hypothetical protein